MASLCAASLGATVVLMSWRVGLVLAPVTQPKALRVR